MTNPIINLAVSDRALLVELAEQSRAFSKHINYATYEKHPGKQKLVAIARRKSEDAETACKVLTAVIASAKTEERHPEAFQDAIEGDIDAIIEYFDELGHKLNG